MAAPTAIAPPPLRFAGREFACRPVMAEPLRRRILWIDRTLARPRPNPKLQRRRVRYANRLMLDVVDGQVLDAPAVRAALDADPALWPDLCDQLCELVAWYAEHGGERGGDERAG